MARTQVNDVYKKVAELLVEQLKQGTAPWQRPWTGIDDRPMNPTTGKQYRGGNAFFLSLCQQASGHDDPR